MPLAFTDYVHPSQVRSLAALGRDPKWLSFVSYEHDGLPCTRLTLDSSKMARGLEPSLLRGIFDLNATCQMASLCLLEALAAAAADGPKLFRPNEEQWEAMEHVEINLPIVDYRQPYPALMVEIPLGARVRLARTIGLDDVGSLPLGVLVRHRQVEGERTVLFTHCGQANTGREVVYVFQDAPANPTVETALQRNAGDDGQCRDGDKMFTFGLYAARAALNLSLALTHFGCQTEARTFRNRAERRASSSFGDFQSVLMKQSVVIRNATRGTTTGDQGVTDRGGYEMAPHWVKGHWRAKSGFGAARAAGETVPLTFVRPYLARADRVVGDLCQSSSEYRG